MRKYLLPKEGKFYKANLHVHSTISDGAKTPEEVKKVYQEKGYSILAFTDHNIFYTHNDLTDENFVALNGMELDFYEGLFTPDFVDKGKSWNTWKAVHALFIALDPNNEIMPCYHRDPEKLRIIGSGKKYFNDIKFDPDKPDFLRSYSIENINKAFKEGHDSGFYTVYSHPVWNIEDYRQYSQYEPLNAMEIFTYSSYKSGWEDYNPKIYDDILRTGKRIHCIAVDDSHVGRPLDSKWSDVGGGFIMIKANELKYKTITNALVKGDFYSSMGPEIKELYFERANDGEEYIGEISITCSPSERIFMNTAGRRRDYAYDKDGLGITKAKFKVYDEDEYVRITIVDSLGKKANTNAYWTDELCKQND